MKKLIVIILFAFISSVASAQIAVDSLSSDALNQLLIEQVERLAEETEDEIDYEELLDNYIFTAKIPSTSIATTLSTCWNCASSTCFSTKP